MVCYELGLKYGAHLWARHSQCGISQLLPLDHTARWVVYIMMGLWGTMGFCVSISKCYYFARSCHGDTKSTLEPLQNVLTFCRCFQMHFLQANIFLVLIYIYISLKSAASVDWCNSVFILKWVPHWYVISALKWGAHLWVRHSYFGVSE